MGRPNSDYSLLAAARGSGHSRVVTASIEPKDFARPPTQEPLAHAPVSATRYLNHRSGGSLSDGCRGPPRIAACVRAFQRPKPRIQRTRTFKRRIQPHQHVRRECMRLCPGGEALLSYHPITFRGSRSSSRSAAAPASTKRPPPSKIIGPTGVFSQERLRPSAPRRFPDLLATGLSVHPWFVYRIDAPPRRGLGPSGGGVLQSPFKCRQPSAESTWAPFDKSLRLHRGLRGPRPPWLENHRGAADACKKKPAYASSKKKTATHASRSGDGPSRRGRIDVVRRRAERRQAALWAQPQPLFLSKAA